ncbi:Sec-independent protein translocase subunit TatA [Streptomyces johnsoniae]|uniref:Sec-independent protein translocase protein TatA n=1 Tax=Streptomyces johnsoniae TaxID=3075532 RepID=A0ABU2S3C9_9ACTN|nr:Sec-independent protein translocase subunit TatA [Streptomyces sp. DSM 41886]MDT0442909.1 Sec-independent protein translocase subunit TatA [Streptomyces sp. DSM 41886]
MGQIGPWQILLVGLLVLLIFGAKRLPDTARSLGKSMRILKSETAAMKKEGDSSGKDGQAPPDTTTSQRTIQAAPGDTETSRPVDEPKRTSQG